jgi:hypothetical protein
MNTIATTIAIAGDTRMAGRTPAGPKVSDRKSGVRPQSDPFDLWLQRGLHQLFDDVASEPVPEDLRRLIEDDRDRTNSSGD